MSEKYYFNYDPLFEYIEKRGITINSMFVDGVFTDNAAQNIRKGRPVGINHIVSICRYLDVPFEQVVEILR